MRRANRRLLKLLACSVLAFLLAASVRCSIVAAAEVPAQEQTVQVPLNRLKELQSLMTSQEQKINLLERQLQEPTSELQKQQTLINELRSDLRAAKNSLDKSELIINEQNKSLTSLSQAIKQEQRREKRIKRQRLIWQVLAGGMAVALVRKTV